MLTATAMNVMELTDREVAVLKLLKTRTHEEVARLFNVPVRLIKEIECVAVRKIKLSAGT